MIYLDTHVVAWLWLYGAQTNRIPSYAKSLIAGNDLLISPMLFFELQYLYELKRANEPAETVLATLESQIELRLCDLPFADVARAACEETWTRDPFDRIIVAHARVRGELLITKDRSIRRHYSEAIWDRPRASAG